MTERVAPGGETQQGGTRCARATCRDRCLWHGSDEPVVMFGREWLVDGRVTGRTVFREAKL